MSNEAPNFADFQIALARDLINLGLSQPKAAQAAKLTFTVTMNAPTGGIVSWVADVNCTLIGVYCVNPGGSSMTLARSNVGSNVVNLASAVTARKVIAWFQGTTTTPFCFLREPFVAGEKLWWRNDSSTAAIVLLVFE